MPQTHLHNTLKDLHKQLEHSPELGDGDRALLSTVLADVQRTLDQDLPHEPHVLALLEDATVSFELKHPALAEVAKQLADILRRAGI